MSKRTWALPAILAAFIATAAHAECTRPSDPPKQFPDGATADRAAMEAAKKSVDSYVHAAQAFVQCVDTAEAAAMKDIQSDDKMGKDEKADRMKALQARHDLRNQVVSQMQATANAFNAEIHKFNQQ